MLDAIILVGGLGKRLQSLIVDVPKPLAPIQGRPFLDILLDQLSKQGMIKRVVLAIGYKADLVRSHYTNALRFPFEIDFSEEEEPLGTGGATRKAISRTTSNPILVINGDVYLDIDLARFFEFHQQHQGKISIALVSVEDIRRYGHVEWDRDSQKISSFREKEEEKKSGYINGGVYLINRKALDSFKEESRFSLEYDVFPSLLFQGIYGFPVTGRFIDIGTAESYKRAQEFFKENL